MPPPIGQVNKYWGRDRGGIEAVLHATVADLRQRGFPVSVLACRPWQAAPGIFPPGVRGRELRAPVLARMPVHLGFRRALAQLSSECALLHFHLPFPLAEAAALTLPKRIPWVATLHAEVVGHAAPLRWCQRAVTQRFLDRADAVVVSSPTSAQARLLLPHSTRVRVIPFGFDLDPFLRQPAPPRPRGDPAPVILFLGRLVAYKGLDVLLRAAAPLEVEIQILGEGPELPRLRRLAAALGMASRVAFGGHVPDQELPRRLRAADIFVLPSRSSAETFGVAQVEAMAAGLPVVNTALATGTDWVSAHGLTGLTVPPDDPAALRAALRHLLADRDFRLACGRRARARARDLFSIQRRGLELTSLYQELLGAAAAAAAAA